MRCSQLAYLTLTAIAACSDPPAMPDGGVDIDAGPALTITPAEFDFGPVELDAIDEPSQTFTIKNETAAAVDLGVGVGGVHPADFVLGMTTCGASLASGATCTLDITFDPKSFDVRTARLEVMGPTLVLAPLRGTATLDSFRLIFDPPGHNFGDIAAGETSAPMTFTVLNEVATGVLTPVIEPPTSAFSVVATDCTATIPIHSACTVSVQWAPGYSGEHSASLRMTIANETYGAGLRGTSSRPLAIDPGSGAMGSLLVGQPEPTLQRTFSITNTGTTTTGTLVPSFVGAGAAAYGVVSTTCTTLAPTASCDVTVHLDPAASTRGSKPAQLSVTDGSPTTIARADLTGSVYTVLIVPQSATTFTVVNASSRPTSTLTVGVTAGFSITADTCAAGIAANGACSITVAGAGTGTLTVSGAIGGSDSAPLDL